MLRKIEVWSLFLLNIYICFLFVVSRLNCKENIYRQNLRRNILGRINNSNLNALE
jgi:hypothetical protein